MNELLEDLQELDNACIGSDRQDFEVLQAIAGECLRVLNISETELYEDILKDVIADETLVAIVEDTPDLRNELSIITELKSLYEQLRAMKLQGKVYEVLDKFFNEQLYRTL